MLEGNIVVAEAVLLLDLERKLSSLRSESDDEEYEIEEESDDEEDGLESGWLDRILNFITVPSSKRKFGWY